MGIAYNPSTIVDGLVFYIDAGNVNSYPGSGNTWYDISGKNYNVTLYNSPAYSNGYIQFRSADSTSKYGTASFDEGVLKSSNQTGSWTIESIFKYVSPPSSIEAVVAGRSGCHGGIYLWSGNYIYNAIKTNQCWTGAINYPVGDPMSIEGIYHVTMTYNNGSVKSYINGVLTATATFNLANYSIFNYSNIFYIGGIPSGGPPQYYATNTDIAIVRCYNKELLASQISQNFNALRGRFGI